MPPQRRSVRLAQRDTPLLFVLVPLPLDLAARVLHGLPIKDRLRAREVCRGWRALLDDASYWSELDLRDCDGANGLPEALLAAAVARAAGGLRSLNLSSTHGFSFNALLAALRANPRLTSLTLTGTQFAVADLNTGEFLVDAAEAAALLDAAPSLRLLHLDACPDVSTALAMLRRQPPFAACRVGRLRLDLEGGEELCVQQLCEAASQSADSLRSLALADCRAAGQPAALCRLLQAARALESLELHACGLDPGQLPLLTELLESAPRLRLLHLGNDGAPLVAGAGAAGFAAALRRSRLDSLCLAEMDLQADVAAAAAALAACTAHPTLRELILLSNPLSGEGGRAAQRAAGGALAALLDAPGGRLEVLDVSDAGLDDDGARPLFAALARSARLRRLDFRYNDCRAAFARTEVLAAVTANQSLRRCELRCVHDELAPLELVEAEEVVRRRGRLHAEGRSWEQAVAASRAGWRDDSG